MSAKAKVEKPAKRYTSEQKEEIIAFINDYKAKNGRGAQKEAAAKYGVSAVTITNWMKATKKKRGRKVGSKNSTSSKRSTALKTQSPEDLRRLASLLEEISELESLTSRLAALKEEAEEISSKILG